MWSSTRVPIRRLAGRVPAAEYLIRAGILHILGRMPAQLSSAATAERSGPIPTVITLFHRAATLMVDDLIRRLEAAGYTDIAPSFHPVFENMDPDGTRLTTLAARAGMTHQSMGELVAAIAARGYLERRPDPADGRARLVCLTTKGRRLARTALNEAAAIEQEWRTRFADAGLDDLYAALDDAIRRHEQHGQAAG